MAIKKEQTLKQLHEMIITIDYHLMIRSWIVNIINDDDDDDSNITHDYSSNLQLRRNLGYHIFLNLKLPSGLGINFMSVKCFIYLCQ